MGVVIKIRRLLVLLDLSITVNTGRVNVLPLLLFLAWLLVHFSATFQSE